MTEVISEVIPSIVIGIFASFIASKIFLRHNNKNNNPLIEISDKLIKSKRISGENSLKIKLINKTKQDLVDINITLEGFENLSPEGHIPLISLLHITNRKLIYIKKFNIKDKNAEYAHRTNLFIQNNNILQEVLQHKKLRISITAHCPYYNTSTILTKDYNIKNDILSNSYSFNTGDSLSATKIS